MKQKLNTGEMPDFAGKKVVVLGAGNTAIDCCEALTKLKAKVTIAFRKELQDMRAAFGEIQKIIKDGVSIQALSQIVNIENGMAVFDLQEKEGNKYQSIGQ